MLVTGIHSSTMRCVCTVLFCVCICVCSVLSVGVEIFVSCFSVPSEFHALKEGKNSACNTVVVVLLTRRTKKWGSPQSSEIEECSLERERSLYKKRDS